MACTVTRQHVRYRLFRRALAMQANTDVSVSTTHYAHRKAAIVKNDRYTPASLHSSKKVQEALLVHTLGTEQCQQLPM